MTLDTIDGDTREAACEFLLAIADDDFLAGQRLSSWLAVSPTLEEDNVVTSIAQDEMGHARLWYDVVAEEREGTTTDELALSRPPEARLNSVLVERPHEDFADLVVRSYVYDHAEQLFLEALRDGTVESVSGKAQVALNEEPFHREHAERWVPVLTSTDEGTNRITRAVRRNLAATRDLFAFDPETVDPLHESGFLARSPADLRTEWEHRILDRVGEMPVDLSATEAGDLLEGEPDHNGRASEHTDALGELLADMTPTEIERI